MKTLLLILLFITTGCATLVQSGPDRIPIKTEPSEAKVYLNGFPVGVTPLVVSVDRKDECEITIEKDNYEKITINRDKTMAGWTLGNLFIPAGFAIDLITHNQGKRSEDPIIQSLKPSKRVPAYSKN